MIAFLPRNCDLQQVSACLPAGQRFCEVERQVLNGVFKGICIYWGSVARDPRKGGEEGGSLPEAAEQQPVEGAPRDGDGEGAAAEGDVRGMQDQKS